MCVCVCVCVYKGISSFITGPLTFAGLFQEPRSTPTLFYLDIL